ncbi:D-alanyl-D-alanine carboxypeptidase/D-alanyl-D-alanine-endopeptidase [bacterium]|nr:D-alanyl-D-alanine carboxypeptidase/D-alanyl-D-alanine-endopeptidase [bacterium]
MNALSVCANPVDKTINSLHVNKGALAVSVRDVKTGNSVYSLNSGMMVNPASTLKLITFASVANTLGFDYEVSTVLYKSTNNDLYLKLVGDPLLASSDLNKLMDTAKEKNIITPKNIYVDSSLFDNVEWGEGWQWDDDLNPLMPKFSAYNLDKNLLNIVITPIGKDIVPTVAVKPFYPLTFMNFLSTDYLSKENKITFSKNPDIENIINISGQVSSGVTKNLPVPNLRRYFILRLEKAISSSKIEYYAPIKNSILPSENVYKVEEVSHSLSDIAKMVLKDSNNMAAESIFKLAGAIYSNSQGSIENSLKMLSNYLSSIGLDVSDVKIVDGSGVSKNNLVSSDFMTQFLCAKSNESDFETYYDLMVSPGQGTLKNRMLYFKDNLKAKTGTLSGVSAIAGYITTRKGRLLAFDIMINDTKASSYDKKNIEEQILRQIYMNY